MARKYQEFRVSTKSISHEITRQEMDTAYQTTTTEIEDTPLEAWTSPKKVIQSIKCLRNGKAPGENGIQASVLKNLPIKMLTQL